MWKTDDRSRQNYCVRFSKIFKGETFFLLEAPNLIIYASQSWNNFSLLIVHSTSWMLQHHEFHIKFRFAFGLRATNSMSNEEVRFLGTFSSRLKSPEGSLFYWIANRRWRVALGNVSQGQHGRTSGVSLARRWYRLLYPRPWEIVNRVRKWYVRVDPSLVKRDGRRRRDVRAPSPVIAVAKLLQLLQLLRCCCALLTSSRFDFIMHRVTRASSHRVGNRAVGAARGKDAPRDDALTQASRTGRGAGYVFCGSRFLPRTILNAVAATLPASLPFSSCFCSFSSSSSRDSPSRLSATASSPRHGARRLSPISMRWIFVVR